MSNSTRREIPFHIPSIDDDDINSVLEVLKSKWITMGSKTAEFEELFAQYIGCKHAIAVNSGTAALHLCLNVISIGNGDEIIIPTNTFTATAEVCLYNNAIPKFVDIDEKTYNLNPELIEANINEKTKTIIPVHIPGYPCDMDRIHEIGKKHNLHVIEDAAHAVESVYKIKKSETSRNLPLSVFTPQKTLLPAKVE